MEVTKGLTINTSTSKGKGITQVIQVEISVSIFNLGFYIKTSKAIWETQNGYGTSNTPEIDTTTRNTVSKVNAYIDTYLESFILDEKDIKWKPNQKVIQDKKGFFKTKL